MVVLPESFWIGHENVEHPSKFAPGCASKALAEWKIGGRPECRDELVGIDSAIEFIPIGCSNDRVLRNLRKYTRKVFKFSTVTVMDFTRGDSVSADAAGEGHFDGGMFYFPTIPSSSSNIRSGPLIPVASNPNPPVSMASIGRLLSAISLSK